MGRSADEIEGEPEDLPKSKIALFPGVQGWLLLIFRLAVFFPRFIFRSAIPAPSNDAFSSLWRCKAVGGNHAHYGRLLARRTCLGPVSYTHLDVYKRQVLGGIGLIP